MRTALVILTALLAAITAPAQWEIQAASTTADLRGIHALGNGVAWASGSEGTVLRTIDDGKDWQRCATPPDGEHLDFRGVQAFDASTAIVMSSGKGALSRRRHASVSPFCPQCATANSCRKGTLQGALNR